MSIKYFLSKLVVFITIAAVFVSCTKFYRHTPKHYQKHKQVTSSLDEKWKLLDSKNIIVIHVGNEMKEIFSIRYDQKSDSVYAKMRDFQGKPLEMYLEVLGSNSQIAKRERKTRMEDAQQIHLFLNAFSKLDEENVSFSVKDIFQVDATEQAVFVNLLASIGVTAATTVVGLGTFLLIACNCPHVYIDNGKGLEFNNTLFTGAKAPQLERFDYKEIPDYFPDSYQFKLLVKNEEQEDQFTNMLELKTILHPSDVEVMADKHGNIHTIRELKQAILATDKAANSVLEFINERDDYPYRFNPENVQDLPELMLSFDASNEVNDAKLVLRARNTLWSGYVYNEFNKLFGRNFDKWVEMNKDKPKEEREKWMREQGIKLLVDVKVNGEWKQLDEVEVFGEASMNQIVVPIKKEFFGQNLEIRLRAGYMFWELDYVGVDFSLNESVVIKDIKVAKATGNKGTDFTQDLQADDALYMKHELANEENATEVIFEDLPTSNTLKRSFILKSKGYYMPKTDYEGKTERKRLQAFVQPAELSRFSFSLYQDVLHQMGKK